MENFLQTYCTWWMTSTCQPSPSLLLSFCYFGKWGGRDGHEYRHLFLGYAANIQLFYHFDILENKNPDKGIEFKGIDDQLTIGKHFLSVILTQYGFIAMLLTNQSFFNPYLTAGLSNSFIQFIQCSLLLLWLSLLLLLSSLLWFMTEQCIAMVGMEDH